MRVATLSAKSQRSEWGHLDLFPGFRDVPSSRLQAERKRPRTHDPAHAPFGVRRGLSDLTQPLDLPPSLLVVVCLQQQGRQVPDVRRQMGASGTTPRLCCGVEYS